MSTMGNIAIDKIKVGDRRREDMGDLDALAQSIDKYGLMQPIVIDVWNNLIAGHAAGRQGLRRQGGTYRSSQAQQDAMADYHAL